MKQGGEKSSGQTLLPQPELQSDVRHWAVLPIDEVSRRLLASLSGLPDDEASHRLSVFGHNANTSNSAHWYHILKRQFLSPFIYLLLGAAVLAAYLGEAIDAAMIVFFVAINALLGFAQEYRSEQTLRKLKRFTSHKARVRRNGGESVIDSQDLVPGDVVVLATGDIVPADLRLFKVDNFLIDESVLTGESVPVSKSIAAMPTLPTTLFSAENLAFAGSAVLKGQAMGLVVATGERSALGGIAKLANELEKESLFTKGIGQFSRFILRLVILTLVLLFVANLAIKGPSNIGELLIFSVALAVSVIPEALPVVTTLSLSRGALLLARKSVVVKRLSAIEDLGGIEILCTDKTGTLTENKLIVHDVFPGSDPAVLLYANLAGNIQETVKTEPFDAALSAALSTTESARFPVFTRLAEMPFDPRLRRNAVLVEGQGERLLLVRGAPEQIVADCIGLSVEERRRILEWVDISGRSGRRVLAVASKAGVDQCDTEVACQSALSFVGLISFIDPIKQSTFGAAEKARRLGVQLRIITGDSKEVAVSVARAIGLDQAEEALSGDELAAMSPERQREAVMQTTVFARITPEQKYMIVSLLQEQKQVGFLGEGINDAPALKKAGVSLVVANASDIAREAADVILLEADLGVIIDGIREGRAVFTNTVKYIKATMTSNFGNFYAVALASLLIDYLPMLPLQILLLNLLSDFPMIAISTDSAAEEDLSQPLRYNNRDIVLSATFLGVVSTFFDFMFFAVFHRISPAALQTNWFIGSVVTELLLLFSIRASGPFWRARRPSVILSVMSLGAIIMAVLLPFTMIGQTTFQFQAPSMGQLAIVFTLAISYFFVTEIVKNIYQRLHRHV